MFFGRNNVEAEIPIFWPHAVKNWLIWKDLDAGKDWRWEEKGTTEDEMARWHHHLNGHEFEWTPGVGGGQGGLACCNSWGHKESDTTEWLNWTELNWCIYSSFSTFLAILKIYYFILIWLQINQVKNSKSKSMKTLIGDILILNSRYEMMNFF